MRYLRPALAAAALALVGCGANTATNSEASPNATIASPTPSNNAAPTPTGASAPADTKGGATTTAVGPSIVPAVDVIDVNTGQFVALRATIATDKPTLIWMWAPH